jgi:hypothetical protein
VYRWVEELPKRSAAEALLLAEELQSFADRLQKAEKLPPRYARAELLKMVADGCRGLRPHDWETLDAITEAHRRILANGNAGLVLDALATRLVGSRQRSNVCDGNLG